ncbi:MAG: response regulator [Gemmatimonadales bacterium]|nr:response regulator [Gemmatimonadales bacterium]NIN51498.1 response regulator [Gemmatimonadales bacterium]NIP08962.1 response regulator [Gemmatimonadales bacterium]NIR03630.1 response regulator [Gemmatimonadales bacterium]NIS67229.1 response regulator [Gemmatimonadales bacterium]
MPASEPVSAAESAVDATALALVELDSELKRSLSLLVIDDERTLRESCRTFLESEGYRVEVCGKGNEALDIVTRRPFDIVLIDQYMGTVPGKTLLQACLQRNPETIAVVMTGNPSISSSIEMLRAGAWDYLSKPFSATQLQILVGRAANTVLVTRESHKQAEAIAKEFGNSDKVTVLGVATSFRRVIEQARQVARTDASVFITGESGTGKELIAQFIHHHSRRSSRPMMAINCAALPETLLESEMFGHRKGAFTDAVRDKPGLLETANGGTMFLDEVTEMSKPIQAKLLRVIQDGVVRRVGSEKVDAVVNVRFIAITNRDPQEATRMGLLREDLFYRLHVVPITVPPLRTRQADVPLLANHFLRYYWDRHRDAGQPRPTLSDASVRTLCAYPWPGNVRELQNLMEHLVVLADPGASVQPAELPFMGTDEAPVLDSGVSIGPVVEDEPYHSARDRILAEFEQQYLMALVNRAAGNMSKAARIAGVDRTTLYRLMEKHGLQRETIMTLADRS